MNSRILLLVPILWCLPALCTHNFTNRRILHGVPDIKVKYPYVVALIVLDKLRGCTGTLITDKWVITAAHCTGDHITHIQYGNMSITPRLSNTKSQILKRFRHPNYIDDPSIFKNDIGLLNVEAIAIKAYGNLSAVDFNTLLGRMVEYAGFGTTIKHKRHEIKSKILAHDITDRPLQLGEGVMLSCDDRLNVKRNYVSVGLLVCVSPKCSNNEQVGHHGDSGGPLFCGNKIIGVANFVGPDYTIPTMAYTPISPYLTWIHKTINTLNVNYVED